MDRIGWDSRSDKVTLGEGVFFKNAFFDFKGEEKQSGGDVLDFSKRKIFSCRTRTYSKVRNFFPS